MIRHAARALCAATLVIAPLALSTPAHAVTTCTVNGVSRTGTTVNGTAGPDYIRCATVNAGDTVNGLGGDDYIVVTTGNLNGTVAGGAGRDYILVQSGIVNGIAGGGGDGDYIAVNNTVAPMGSVFGDSGNDFLRVGVNNGVVNAGLGLDVCRVGSGNPPVGCEA
ncbi:hypothetical protein ACHGLA_28900 [Streptomyces sp. YH02]|uniref:hypothetical protein n=1 Tax=Streptomyces sp. YH02 TaxID=3256999 RepID=UPI0037581F8A